MKGKKQSEKVTAVSKKVLSRMLPIFILDIAVIVTVIFFFGGRVIRNMLYTSLESEASDDAGTVNRELNATFYYLNGIADTIENVEWKDDKEITTYLGTTMKRYPLIPTGAYLGLSDKKYLDPSGWNPGKDYDVTTMSWYKQGMSYNNKYFYYSGEPYFDDDTKKLCTTVIRHVHLKDGREGVFACDLMIESIQKSLKKITFYNTGHVMMVTKKGMILANPTDSLNGKTLTKSNDPLFKALSKSSNHKNGQVTTISTSRGTYYTVSENISGTDWDVVIYADRASVLSDIIYMIIIVLVLGIIAVVVYIIVMMYLLKKYIRKPVESLTDNIGHIAQGDFTVDIETKGNDEIAYMNRSMDDFIGGMRGSISNLKDVAEKLIRDSKTTQDAAESLEKAADEQSISMDQIRENTKNMADAVTDVAQNATTLAQTVSDLVTSENQVEEVMKALVDKANDGQTDMSAVADNMDNIVVSMNEMDDAVKSVDQAADEITKIVDLIDEISDQTELLSLNASIEAARAGEAGKGFAVVASEIGGLATNSAEDTKKISDIVAKMSKRVKDLSAKAQANTQLINDSASSVSTAAETFKSITEEVHKATNTLSSMTDMMGKVNDVASTMASASEEQSATTQEIAATVETVAENAKGVAESSKDVFGASSSVSDAADSINGDLNRFTIQK
ncbi:MAG: methyl-accepting chemotaxis protein [Lachnospiraceae bacterium]|uniref:Methyl-accepting chemotaxis protein n=1 Tax=Candidatus Weimeria bifida TaxID=2599074 RepID=A0A6N7IYV0_9FIRM|nr:methyl-accepting chemotaxis protein [Candidatus Weimeria bifida]RRF97157.1 MAG: methyl-accepting chemotaxis protein [Lachnospiraceae bacterium]